MGSNGTGGGGGGPCGACKFLRRKCVKNCVFAPYFDSEEGTRRFAAVHRVFGASNASKILLRVPPHRRLDAVVSMCYEALSRVRDPVYGCMSSIFALQRQIDNLQTELSYIHAQISVLQHTHQPDDQLPLIDVFLSPTPMTNASTISLLHPDPTRPKQTMLSIPRCPSTDNLRNQEPEENDLEMLARGFLASYAARMDE